MGTQLAATRVAPEASTWVRPTLLFAIVVVAASGCVVTSLAVLDAARRDDLAELGLLGAAFSSVSVLPLVHGITTPGVLYGPNGATSSSVFWALPLALVAVAPLLLGRHAAGLLRYWRLWVGGQLVLQAGLAGTLLLRPDSLPFAPMGSPVAVGLASASLLGCLALSARHLWLYWIGRAEGSFLVAAGIALVGASTLVWAEPEPYTVGFWLAHALDIVGVFLATILAARTYRQGALTRSVLRPLTATDPVSALALGLDPIVDRFVADLGRKDVITRDHVVRTCELALGVGSAFSLPAGQLRDLGLGALLHDVGKLEISDAILGKPGRLDPDERAEMERHTLVGERLVRDSGALAGIGPIVRSHHERIDGRGYPDRLAGDAIPRLARIVSVCDGFDAMVHTRQYRSGMGIDGALSVLAEHAGSQWDACVVEVLVALVRDGRAPLAPTALADVGRSHDVATPCIDAVPGALVHTGS